MNKIADEIANITRDGVGKAALKAAETMQAQADALVDKEYGLLIDKIRAIAPHSFQYRYNCTERWMSDCIAKRLVQDGFEVFRCGARNANGDYCVHAGTDLLISWCSYKEQLAIRAFPESYETPKNRLNSYVDCKKSSCSGHKSILNRIADFLF